MTSRGEMASAESAPGPRFGAGRRLLDLRPGEGIPILLFFGNSLCLGLFVTAFFSVANILFLRTFEIEFLPFAYVASGLVGWAAGAAFHRAQSRVSYRLVTTGTISMLLLTVILFRLGRHLTQAQWLSFAMFAFVMPMATMAQLQFWTLASRAFNLEQGKRLFSLVSSGDVVASIAGFLGLVTIIRWIGGVDNLLWLAAAGLGGCLGIVILTLALVPEPDASDPVRPPPESEPRTSAPARGSAPPRDRYLLLMGVLNFCTILGLYFVDFAFMGEIRAHFGSGEGLARFIGIFFGMAKTLELVFKTTISGRLIREYGVKLGLVALPSALLVPILLALAGSLFGSGSGVDLETVARGGGWLFVMIALAKLADRIVRKALEDPSLKLLFQPLPRRDRLAAQSRVEIIRQVGQAASGVALVGLTVAGWSRPGRFLWVLLFLAGAWLVGAVLTYRQYHARVLTTLTQHPRTVALTTLQRWAEQLAQSDSESLHHSLRLLHRVAPRLLHPLAELLRGLADPAVGTAATDAVRSVEKEKAVSTTALPAFLKLGPQALGERTVRLAESIDPHERQQAADLIREIGDPAETGVLGRLLVDRDPEVCRAALRAIQSPRDANLASSVAELLGRPELSGAAIEALVRLGEPSLEAAARLVSHSSTPVQVLLQVLDVVAAIESPRSAPLLVEALGHPAGAVRGRALSLLVSTGYQVPADLEILVVTRLDGLLAEVTWTMAATIDLGSGDRWSALREQLQSERTRLLDRIFLYLSILYDPKAIGLVRDHYASDAPDSRAYALEVVDMVVSPEIKRRLVPLLEDLTEMQRLSRLSHSFPQERFSATERVRDILTVGYSRIGRWTRAHALLTLTEEDGSGEGLDLLLANLPNPDPLLREIAAQEIERRAPSLLRHRLEMMTLDEQRALAGIVAPEGWAFARARRRPTIYDKVGHLAAGGPFANLPPLALVDLAVSARDVNLRAEKLLIREGDESSTMYVVLEGTLRVEHDGRILAIVGPGSVVGEMGVVELQARSASVIAGTEASLLEISRDAIFHLMSTHHEVIRTIVGLISRRRRNDSTRPAA